MSAMSTVDGSGNTYVTGQNTSGSGFYVTEYNSTGAQVYNANIGTGTIYPFRVRVDGSGRAYVAGYLDSRYAADWVQLLPKYLG